MSTDAIRRANSKYQKEHRKTIGIVLPTEIADEFDQIIQAKGLARNTELRRMIEEFIAENK